MERAKVIYGIDFGTSNSTLVVLDVAKNEAVAIFTVPSLLFFPDADRSTLNPHHLVGHDAVEGYVGNRMRGRFMKSIKKVLPNKRFSHTRIAGKNFTAEELVSFVLSDLKAKADAHVGEDVKTAVIGRPVVFDSDPVTDKLAQSRLLKAAKMAGFEHVFFQMEPIGAAFTYERKITQDELVLVADFGGGTSDFSLMRLNPGSKNDPDRTKDMIAKGGIYIGGDNFDSSIMWERGTPHFGKGLPYQSSPDKWLPVPVSFFHNICTWERMNFFDSILIQRDVENYYELSGKRVELRNLLSLIQNNLGYTIFQEIERAKIELSSAPKTLFAFHRDEIDFDEEITQVDFGNEIIHKDLDRILEYLNAFLVQSDVTVSQIDSVFMTGGTSRILPLRQRFEALFGPDKLRSGDDFNSVAIGLAYSYRLFGE
ncbi:MAG: Hsp70 family protein [Bacteroidia bacterium]